MRTEFQLRGRTAFALTLALALLAAFAQTAISQEVTAAITGQVTDPSGATVAGATVTARDVDRGAVWKTQTNDEGVYSLPRLPIGRYEVQIEAKGFQTAVQKPFELTLNHTAKVDVQLLVGQATQTVEVSAAAPLLQTETTHVGTVMEDQTIAGLPLQTRNYNQLALLIPGAVTISPASFTSELLP